MLIMLEHRKNMNLKLLQGNTLNVRYDSKNTDTHFTVEEEIPEDMFIESLIIFKDTDFHGHINDISYYFGSKESVDKFILVNSILHKIEILDIIQEEHGRPYYVLLNRKPIFNYIRRSDYLIAEDNGVFNFYKYRTPVKGGYAFDGLEFDIPLINGTVEHAYGQWWDMVPEDYNDLVYLIGYGDKEGFTNRLYKTTYIRKDIIDSWLLTNSLSTDPHKYYKQSSDI